MRSQLFAVLALAALATSASVGCAAGEPDDAGDGEASEDALTNRQLPDVAAVEIAEVRAQETVLSSKTIGAPKKVKSVVTAVKKLRPSDPVPRCLMQDTTRLTFLNATGKKVATVSTHCAGFGEISFENGDPGYGVRYKTEIVDAAKNAPFAVGDALWGITLIEFTKPGSPGKWTVSRAEVKPVVDGFKLDEVPDASASPPRCLPSHAVTFKRGASNVAFTSLFCGIAAADASIKAQFTAPDPAAPPDSPALASGGIHLDSRPLLRAFGRWQCEAEQHAFGMSAAAALSFCYP